MKKIIMSLFLISVVSICKAQITQNATLEGVRKEIEASNAIYSDLANKNDNSILTRYTEDACLLPSNAPRVCGYEYLAKFFKDGPKINGKFTIVNLYGDGKEYVTEESVYEISSLDGKKLDDGKILVIWKKTKDGWKMHHDMLSSNHEQKK